MRLLAHGYEVNDGATLDIVVRLVETDMHFSGTGNHLTIKRSNQSIGGNGEILGPDDASR